MAGYTFLCDGSIEFQHVLRRVAGRNIPPESVKPRKWRFKQVVPHLNQEGTAQHSSPDLVSNRIVGGESLFLKAMEHRSIVRGHAEHAARALMSNDGIGVRLWLYKGLSHRRRQVSYGFAAVTFDANRGSVIF